MGLDSGYPAEEKGDRGSRNRTNRDGWSRLIAGQQDEVLMMTGLVTA
jgi:hypothetical protein